MTFNIGSQTGGVINNVQGDQRISGGQQGLLAPAAHASQAIGDLRHALAAAALDGTTAAKAHAQMTELEAAIRPTRPDRSRFARALERLTRLLSAAGSLSTAGAALIGPLQTLAVWLGALGEPILRLLPVLG
jgi:hypothetical protein